MQTTINTTQCNDALDLVTRFVSKHATLPILENIYLNASIDSLTLKGTDMEKHIQLSIPATVNQEGSITVNAKTFQNIIKTIDGDEIELVAGSDDSLTIKSATDTFTIKGISSSEYVALPEVQGDKSNIIDTNTLINGISKIEYTISEKNFSPVLTGLLVRVQDDENAKIIFAGSDSFRLAEYKSPIIGSHTPCTVIIPKTNIVDLQKVFEYQHEHGGEEVTIRFSDNMIAFICPTDMGEVLATSLLIQGKFPDYNNEAIIPTQYKTSVIVDKDQLDKAIRKILILTRDINNYLLIKTTDNKLTITS
ncbi:MAG: DNA polymerase III subunit beta [Candidatus Peribacteria bacterium]|nr:MAG: DNA polymerase III subunit beta [Candidatus Peribacteria bacterium]